MLIRAALNAQYDVFRERKIKKPVWIKVKARPATRFKYQQRYFYSVDCSIDVDFKDTTQFGPGVIVNHSLRSTIKLLFWQLFILLNEEQNICHWEHD